MMRASSQSEEDSPASPASSSDEEDPLLEEDFESSFDFCDGYGGGWMVPGKPGEEEETEAQKAMVATATSVAVLVGFIFLLILGFHCILSAFLQIVAG